MVEWLFQYVVDECWRPKVSFRWDYGLHGGEGGTEGGIVLLEPVSNTACKHWSWVVTEMEFLLNFSQEINEIRCLSIYRLSQYTFQSLNISAYITSFVALPFQCRNNLFKLVLILLIMYVSHYHILLILNIFFFLFCYFSECFIYFSFQMKIPTQYD